MSKSHTLKKADNGYFYAYWSEGKRSLRESMRTKNETEARAAYARFLTRTEADTAQSALTVAALWRLYDEKHLQAKTVSAKGIGARWKNLEAFFGSKLVGQVDQDLVDLYERRRIAGKIGQKSSPGTVRTELSHLIACLRWCAHPRRKIISKAEVPEFALPNAHEPRDRWLTLPEVQKLLDTACELRTGATLSTGERFLWLALETAARAKAIQELTWDRVDFDTGVVHYNVPGRAKTKKRRGSPPMSKALRGVLLRAKAEHDGTSNLVIGPTRDIWGVIKRIARKADLPDVSPHVLRHTAATQMARRGVPLTTIADVLSNSVAICEKHYRHHCPHATRDAVEFISGGLLEAAE